MSIVPRQMVDTMPNTRSAKGRPTLPSAPGSASRPAPKRPVFWVSHECCDQGARSSLHSRRAESIMMNTQLKEIDRSRTFEKYQRGRPCPHQGLGRLPPPRSSLPSCARRAAIVIGSVEKAMRPPRGAGGGGLVGPGGLQWDLHPHAAGAPVAVLCCAVL